VRRRTRTVLISAGAASVLVAASAVVASQAGAAAAAPVNRPVIVVLKDQPGQAQADRADAISLDQAALMDELAQAHSTGVKRYQLVNAFAATVSAQEEARLSSNPLVREVIPDVTLTYDADDTATAATTTSKTTSKSTLPTHNIPGACGANGAVQLAPEGLSLTGTDSASPGQPTARSLGFTGAGVKIAWIADGVDTDNVNLIRPDGKSVFTDYQDFTGTGPGAQTSGDEAFLDSNQLAGQGTHVYNLNGISAQSYRTPCNIRIEGVAPGASLVGLDVYSESTNLPILTTTEGNLLEAINYAVETDHVDVLNESFGDNEFPDIESMDVVQQFDDAAVAAGVVVVASSGDAGPANSIATPATDPAVISVGASTQYQAYAQTNYAAARYFATTGWLDDNISPMSSGGYDEAGGTVDLVAPGDISFASCDASSNYTGCTNFLTNSSDLEESGGTSESAPFVAGAAALVIQAYRKTHGDASPTPALVKQILLSTATNLGAPATEQGAGLLNSYKAVEQAESIGAYQGTGSTLLLSSSQLTAAGAAGSSHSWPVTVTNTGADAQDVSFTGRAIGPDQDMQAGRVKLSDSSSPHFDNYAGVTNNYGVFHFTVAPGQDQLTAALAWPGDPSYCLGDGCDEGLNARVRMILVDPRGRLAAHSVPQGPGNSGTVQVRYPAAGTWTGVIFGDNEANGGTTGTVPWRVATQQFTSFGSVSPSAVSLAPGQSRTVTVTAATPSSPGDAAGSIVLSNGSSIAVTLRSLVNVAAGGTFSGTLTGGDGRVPGEGQTQYYEFNVGSGVRDVSASVRFANDPLDPVSEYLISPDGDTLGYASNSLAGVYENALTAWTLNPVAGTWTLIVEFAEPVAGNEVSQPYIGSIAFSQVSAHAAGLPDSPDVTLAKGKAVTVPVSITNTGVASEGYYIDARLDSTESLSLDELGELTSNVTNLPLIGPYPYWLIPTETSSLQVSQSATVPAMFYLSPFPGAPDISSSGAGPGTMCSDNAAITYSPPGGTVTAGAWDVQPTECGPYPVLATYGTATLTVTAVTRTFDPAITSTTGDLFSLAANPLAAVTPLVINPGQTATIDVTITPSASPGALVSGDLYVDDLAGPLAPSGQTTGDELVALPYKYTVGT